jgi:hypothetical protein
MLVAPRVPRGTRGEGGSWNVTLPGLRPHGMNCYGTLPVGSGQYCGGLRLPFTYLRITIVTVANAVRRIFTVVIFFVCGLL